MRGCPRRAILILLSIGLVGLMSSGCESPSYTVEPAAIPFFGSDVVVVIDRSTLAMVSSGVDVDKDGVVGRDRRQVRERDIYSQPAKFWTTDSGDTIGALQLQIAQSLVERLALRHNRVGLESFTLRVRWQGATPSRLTLKSEVSVPVGAAEPVLAALADFPAADERMRTDLSRLLKRGEALLDEASTDFGPKRPRAILLLSLGRPSAPDGMYWSSRRALSRAAELAERGIAVWAVALRSEDVGYLEELTSQGKGGVISIGDLDSRFGVPAT